MNRTRTQQTTAPRMQPADVREVVSPGDQAARDIVLTMGGPKVVLIKINNEDTLGLPEAGYVGTDSRKIEEHQATASRFGIDAEAFRDKQGHVHSGKQLCNNGSRIRLGQLLEDMKAAGYNYTGGRWRQKPAQPGRRAPDPTLEFVFSLEGTEIEMPDHVRDFLTTTYVDGFFHWANPKMTADGTPWRLDTLNGYAGPVPKDTAAKPGYVLRLDAEHRTGFNLE